MSSEYKVLGNPYEMARIEYALANSTGWSDYLAASDRYERANPRPEPKIRGRGRVLSDAEREAIIARYALGTATQRGLAKEFGVSKTYIVKILRWADPESKERAKSISTCDTYRCAVAVPQFF
jgi:hypothetical protein